MHVENCLQTFVKIIGKILPVVLCAVIFFFRQIAISTELALVAF